MGCGAFRLPRGDALPVMTRLGAFLDLRPPGAGAHGEAGRRLSDLPTQPGMHARLWGKGGETLGSFLVERGLTRGVSEMEKEGFRAGTYG